MGEALVGLHAFQYENWLPRHDDELVDRAPPKKAHQAHVKQPSISLDQHLEKGKAGIGGSERSDEASASDNGDGESVIGDFTKVPEGDDLRPFDDVSATTATTSTTIAASTHDSGQASPQNSATTTITADSVAGGTFLEDDPRTSIEMHPSIQDALKAYAQIMEHPQKTNSACEEALSCVKQLVVRNYVSGRAGGRDDSSGSGAAARDVPKTEDGKVSPANKKSPSLLHQVLVGIQKCSESNMESIQSKVIETYKEILTNPQCSVHEASMLLVIRSIFHIYLVGSTLPVRDSAKAALVDMVSNIILRMEEIQGKQQMTDSLFHTDGFYLLRSLVKLSSKELAGIDDKSTTPTNFLAQQFLTTTTVDPLALNNKILSLELILTAMECAGGSLCNGERFVHLIQAQLCVGLLKNCMSNNSQISYISQRIFLVLVSKFKAHLREEIQLFMTTIFLRVIDSDNSSFAQKALVLESLRSLCNDPQLLTQIFLNYDCDFDSMNLYKDIVSQLTKLCAKTNATPMANMNKKDAEKHSELSLASVEVLVTILGAFLKALGLEVDDAEQNDIAGAKIRNKLQLQDVGNLKASPFLKMKFSGDAPSTDISSPIVRMEQGELSVEDLQRMQNDDTPALPHSESSADVAGKIVDAFDRKRNAEQNFELGSVKFTLNLKDGINFFVDNEFVTLDAKELALFFLANKDKLDKTQMGEVLGREPGAAFVKKGEQDPEKGGPGFYVRILHHYIVAQDYSGQLFDDAIRLFLSGFRLPGEAQKIDRIMEKFAEQFTKQNPGVFPNADTAFILAFSVIMLNTDLHNPSIKPEKRMTVDAFLRNNRGIGENGADLPEDFLRGIFARIKKSPFSLKEDDAAREKAMNDMQDSFFVGEGGLLGFGLVGPPTTAERKKEQLKKERQEMLSATEELMRRRKRKTSTATGRSTTANVDPADVVKPIFDVTWGPVLGIFSQVIEMAMDAQRVTVCFNGFVYAIRIASRSHMSLARETFINSLMKFTLLGSVKEMKPKNIEAIQTILRVAAIDGEHLGESWGPVLQCISQLAKMRTAASGLKSDESFLEDATSTKPTKQPPQKNYFGAQSAASKAEDSAKETEQSNQRAVLATVSEDVIDKVFSSTVKLSAHSLADFMRQLVLVSTTEIAGDTKKSITGVAASSTGSMHGPEDGPSIFSLQRLVEVADYNMDVRPRLVWSQIWEIMGDFFAKAGCNRNSMVSVFAIDSLKQLSSKFLEKPELSEFHFQRMFLRPFLSILENPTTRQDIRELILECVAQIVDRKAHNLQSGWKIFFDIVMISAQNDSAKITLRALNILQKMLDEHLDKLTRLAKIDPECTAIDEMSSVEKRNRNSNAEDFIGMCRTSLSFVQIKDNDASPIPLGVSMRALCHMAIYADLIADGRIVPPVSGAQKSDPKAFGYTYDGLVETEELEMVLWRPILEGLADGLRSPSRNRADGIGCMIQRGSTLALRAILLRHGALFSKTQLAAILEQTLVPTIQRAAENDLSPVVAITSESPAITGLDFLTEPLPLPPPRYDRGLLKFEEVARSVECAPSRPLGPAELLLEACMTDMRHGGDGDLTQAYKFAKKDMSSNSSDAEQPFPDSWIATTGPVALGCVTDIASEVLLQHHGSEGALVLWPIVGPLYQEWCNGICYQDEDGRYALGSWAPCEALVRIATKEIKRFASRLVVSLPKLSPTDGQVWCETFVKFFSDTLTQSLDIEHGIEKELLEQKLRAYKQSRGDHESVDGVSLSSADRDIMQEGTVKADGTMTTTTPNSPPTSPQNGASFAWVKLVPVLKIRCITAYFLQQVVEVFRDPIVCSCLTEATATQLLEDLQRSRRMGELSVRSEDMAHAFQEAILSEWGDGEDDAFMGEEALVNIARLSQTQGSAMFFLTQTAGATQALIWVLGGLFECKNKEEQRDGGEPLTSALEWDRPGFAAPSLLEIITDVLHKFVASETQEGARMDPNVWRNAAESGVKIAVYCTSFASVVLELLQSIRAFDEYHMQRHGAAFFPMICRLISVQSEEIRNLVQQILVEKFGPLVSLASAAAPLPPPATITPFVMLAASTKEEENEEEKEEVDTPQSVLLEEANDPSSPSSPPEATPLAVAPPEEEDASQQDESPPIMVEEEVKITGEEEVVAGETSQEEEEEDTLDYQNHDHEEALATTPTDDTTNSLLTEEGKLQDDKLDEEEDFEQVEAM